MEFAGWDIIITLIVAVYGAVLSTITILVERQRHKRETKVTLGVGFIKIIDVSPPSLLLTAINTGNKTVTLSAMGLILSKEKYLYFTRPNSYVNFPYELPEGKNVMVWIATKELAQDLKNEGYSGTTKFKGFYRDAVGKEYKSKATRFDIDGYVKMQK